MVGRTVEHCFGLLVLIRCTQNLYDGLVHSSVGSNFLSFIVIEAAAKHFGEELPISFQLSQFTTTKILFLFFMYAVLKL